MGEFRGINKYSCVILLALLAFNEVIITTQGRKEYSSWVNTNVGEGKAHRPTMPGNSPGVGHHLKHMMMEAKAQHMLNDFRPTTPGHSPGVGHRR